MAGRHAVLIHPTLCFSGVTERMLATARALAEQGLSVTIVSTPGTRSHAIEASGSRVCFAELPSDPWRAPFAAWRAQRLLRKLAPDVVHATDDSLAPLVAVVAPRLRVPWILELHSPAQGPLLGDARNLAAVIASSGSLVESVVNHGGVQRELVRVVKNAPRPIESDSLDASGEEIHHDGPVTIGCSGFLNDAHATEWFLEAARLLVVSGARAMFLVLGEGPNEGRLRRLVRERGLTERVTIAVPTTPEAGQCLAALDVHVSCKLDGGPGWLACLAMAQGVPSVFVASGDAYDLVEDRRSGVIVEASSPRRLADELAVLCANPRAARQMGRRGRARIQAYAPPARFDYEIAELYAVTLGTASRGR